MKTIGRKWPRNAPRGDHPWLCDYCGARWRRSTLTRQQSGYLACVLCEGDRFAGRPRHVQNNEGTGSIDGGPGLQNSDPYPVLF